MKTISESFIDSLSDEEKHRSLVIFRCFESKLSIPGSKNGHFPDFKLSILDILLSIHTVWYPNSAKQAPDTKPTYPVPTIANFIIIL